MRILLPSATWGCIILLVTVSSAQGPNVLVNPSFDDPPLGIDQPPTGWDAFGHVNAEPSNPPKFVPLSGEGLCSMFGSFTGEFNVSGIFQEFPTAPGVTWRLSSHARHSSLDAITGIGQGSCTPECSDNWVVQRIAWFDATGTEISGVESVILDGTFTTDVWHVAAPISGTAPAGTVTVQALILYLQPLFGEGAAHVDDVDFRETGTAVEATTWGAIKSLYE